MNKILLALPVCAAPLLAGVVSYGKTAEPHEVLLSSVQAARDNDLPKLLKLALTPDEYAELEAQWQTERTRELEPNEEFGFAVTMQMLVADGAEEQLFAQLEPKLAEMEPQMAMVAGMVTGLANAQLDERTDLTPDQQEDARRVLEGLAQLLQEGKLTDPEHAKRAIAALCQGARQLELTSLDELRALEFEELLEKGGVVSATVKDVLAVYGVDVNAWLDSVEAETVSVEGDVATVRVSYEVFGQSFDTEAKLHRVDGRWYGERPVADAAPVATTR